MATSTLGSGTLVLAGTTSGTTTVTATAVAGTTTLTLPAATDTLVGRATTDTLTNKTLTGAVMNGTLGATTPSTVAATTLTTSSTVTHNGGTANGVAYLDGSKVLTTGSALVFDGTNLGLATTPASWSAVKAIQYLNGAAWGISTTDAGLSQNAYFNSGWKYISSSTGATLYAMSSGAHAWSIAPSGTAGNAITFTQAMTLDASGNLGVGITSLTQRFQVERSFDGSTWAKISNGNSTSGAAAGVLLGTDQGDAGALSQNSSNAAYGTAANAVRLRNLLNAPITFETNGSERARIDSSGNLGLGVTPKTIDLGKSFEIGVAGSGLWSTGSATDIRMMSNVYYNNGYKFAGTGRAAVFLINAGEFIWQQSTASGTVGNAVTSSNTMTLDASGNLLVGATSTSGNVVQIYNNSNQAGRININKTTSGLFNAIANSYSGTYVGGVNYDNTTTSFPTSSDVRLKKDIVDAGSASAKIDQIRIVSHGWKHDDAVVEFGVIAQELVNVAPQAVSAGDDGEEIETTWGVDYSKLVPMLIKAHQEQQAIITTLTARITALESA